MRLWRHFALASAFYLTVVHCVVAQPAFANAEITSLRQLKGLTEALAAARPAVRIRGAVVCHDAGWHQLYVNDGHETLYFNADEFAVQPQKGDLIEITGRARGTNTFDNGKLTILGQTNLPEALPMELSGLGQNHGEWVEVRGRVLSAESSRGRLALLLHDKGLNCLVYLLGGPAPGNYRQWLNCRVDLRGINASRMDGDRLDSGLIFAPGPDEIKVIEPAGPSPSQLPVASIGSLFNRELGAWTNQWVHINGLVVSYRPGESITVKDPTGVIRAHIIQSTEIRGDERVNVWGFEKAAPDETFLDNAYFEVAPIPSPESGAAPQSAPLSRVAKLPDVLTQVSEIAKLRPEEAAQAIAVRLRGVITYADPEWRNGFFQDHSDAIYVDIDPSQKNIQSGQWVELTGRTSPGGFAPEVLSSDIKILGVTNLPTPAHVDLEDLANGRFDSHWVEMEGLVRRVDEASDHVNLSLMTPKGRFKAILPGFDNKALPTNLIDALVSVQGACTSDLNVRRQLSGITLHVPSLEQIKILEPAPADPFAAGTTRIAAVATFDPDRFAGRRVKIQGVVTLRITGQGFVIQDDSGGMRVFTRQTNEVHLGDLVEAIGFPAIGGFSPYLEEAIYRTLGTAPMPAARKVTAEQILLYGTNDAQIVTLDAQLLQSVPRSANPQMTLQAGPIIFTAQLEQRTRGQEVSDLESGCRLRLTGVCSIQGGEGHEPQAFRLLMNHTDDIQLLESPPYWTAARAFMLAGGLMLAVSAALGWVALLRRQVRSQTRLIRQKLEDEAALEARYRELFENATEMLYTHDHEGRITSVNQTGERILQRSRKELLGKNIVELVAEEQRAAARQWLERLLGGATVPDVEWDVIAASGERVRLEISARLIGENGHPGEVEGVARDITERKRLEREILEISNREQRRIGHDLHDGVCQQLAGIAFLTSTLAEELADDGIAQSSQAEKISGMINEAIDQTRAVARGLFPVRLDEEGLVAALAQMAEHATEIFKIKCRFRAEGPPLIVESEVALHLHYIVLEALANAAKHSGCSRVDITLQPSGDRWLLTIQDDGAGFAPTARHSDSMGLRIMHYRARVIGATLNLQSQTGCCTKITCLFLPVSRELPRGAAPRRQREDPGPVEDAQLDEP